MLVTNIGSVIPLHESSISLKKTFKAKEFSDLLGEIRARLEYTEVDGKREAVK